MTKAFFSKYLTHIYNVYCICSIIRDMPLCLLHLKLSIFRPPVHNTKIPKFFLFLLEITIFLSIFFYQFSLIRKIRFSDCPITCRGVRFSYFIIYFINFLESIKKETKKINSLGLFALVFCSVRAYHLQKWLSAFFLSFYTSLIR